MRSVMISIRTTIVFMVVCGLLYPLLLVLVGQAAFPFQAQGEMLRGTSGRIVGSQLIAQATTSPGLFQPRPSAVNYNGDGSGGSNLGPTNPALIAEIRANLAQVLKQNPGLTASRVTPGMVESSASGLDPTISVTDAMLQVPRIAAATGLSRAQLGNVVLENERGRFLGVFGEPRINVLDVNLFLLQLEHRPLR